MANFLAAVRNGQPTAIFEDPCPALVEIAATSMPRQPPGGMNPMMMGAPPLPKGDISELWRMLGVDFAADQIVWQKYNPYPKIQQFPEEFVFIDRGEGAKEPFGHKDAISAGLQQVLLPFPGWMSKLNVSGLEFIPLLRTGKTTGAVSYADLREDHGAALGRPRARSTCWPPTSAASSRRIRRWRTKLPPPGSPPRSRRSRR